MRIHWSILNDTFIEADFITRHDKIKNLKSNVCLKSLKRKLHLSTLEGHQVTKALLIITEVISRSSLTLKLSHRCWLWKSNCLTRFPSLFKLSNFFKYTFPCLFSTPEKCNTQIPEPRPLILSSGFGSSGDGCCPLTSELRTREVLPPGPSELCSSGGSWVRHVGGRKSIISMKSGARRSCWGESLLWVLRCCLYQGTLHRATLPGFYWREKHHNSSVPFLSLVLTD